MKNKKIRVLIILFSTFLLLGSVGLTMAIFSSSTDLENDFDVANYSIDTEEIFTSPDDWTPGTTTPKTLTIQNTGNINVKARVCISEEWISANNDSLPLEQDGERVAIINLDNTNDWKKIDNCFYYNDTLEPNDETSSFIQSVTYNPNVEPDLTCTSTTINGVTTRHCDSSGDGYDDATYILTFRVQTLQEDLYETEWADEGTLYGIVMNEYRSNSGYAELSTGSHKDSFDRNPITNIYYYKSSSANSDAVSNKINVIFAGFCWQMIRTTDTGGVRMVYNGVPVDGKCLNTRSNQKGLSQNSTTIDLNGNYAYGTDFTYDLTNDTFKLSGTIKTNINIMNDNSVFGYYTCKDVDPDSVCSTLYYAESDNGENILGTQFQITSTNYAQIGSSTFNYTQFSLSMVGYMYNKSYYHTALVRYADSKSFTTTKNVFDSNYYSSSLYYASSVDFDDTVPGKYSLINKSSTGANSFSILIGKYSFLSSNANYNSDTIYYVVNYSGRTVYYLTLKNGDTISSLPSFQLGSSVINNGNGTYTLDNTITVSLSDYYSNYSNFINKYMCPDYSNTCENPIYISSADSISYRYIENPFDEIVISKSRNGLELTETISVTIADLLSNYSNYSDYIYTCNSSSNICTEESIRRIKSITATGYNYNKNVYIGSSVTWDGTQYTLNDTISMIDVTSISTIGAGRHYYCAGVAQTKCQSVNYIYSNNGNSVGLTDGVRSIRDALNNMLYSNDVNTKDSYVKRMIEEWYYNNLLDYDDYLEETIYCNNRTISSYCGWNDQNGYNPCDLSFQQNYNYNCERVTDQFSVSNNIAKLKYKIGLIGYLDISKLYGVRKTGSAYWLLSPEGMYNTYNSVYIYIIDSNGNTNKSYIPNNTAGVRPVISLARGTTPVSGTGTMADPYVIETN